MDSTTDMNVVEPVTMSDVLGLASWNRQRSDDELRAFIARHETAVANTVDLSA